MHRIASSVLSTIFCCLLLHDQLLCLLDFCLYMLQSLSGTFCVHVSWIYHINAWIRSWSHWRLQKSVWLQNGSCQSHIRSSINAKGHGNFKYKNWKNYTRCPQKNFNFTWLYTEPHMRHQHVYSVSNLAHMYSFINPPWICSIRGRERDILK